MQRIPPLTATLTPQRPMEEEKDKSKKRRDEEDNDGSGGKEWKQVAGGFVPKFLKKGAAGAVELVDTIEDYKRVVVDEPSRIVVVRFFAPWCKSCKAAHPHFKKMVARHAPNVKFVEVPLTKETAYIHEGLGVPSVPFGHIYHPEAGLVEEMKINKRVIKDFSDALDCYVRGDCYIPIEDGDGDSALADDVGFQ